MYNVYPETEHSEEKKDGINILIELFDTDIISILIQIVSGTVYDKNSLFFWYYILYRHYKKFVIIYHAGFIFKVFDTENNTVYTIN